MSYRSRFSFWKRLRFYILWPGLYIYFRLNYHRTRVIIRCKSEVLLIRDSTRYGYDDRSWSLPGGGIGRSEEDSVAAVREVREELGIVLEPDTLTHLGERIITSEGISYLAQYYVVDIIRKPQLQLDSREVSGAAWYRLNEVSSLPQKPELTAGLELLSPKR
jgi:8-oxo-dGTP pyrophosphatase MutT (NUDIX family)